MFQIPARLILMCAVALQSLVWAPTVPTRGHSLTQTTSIEPPRPEQIEQMNFESAVKAGRACECHTPGLYQTLSRVSRRKTFTTGYNVCLG
ncbi:uncharacterized protein PGTG_22692 [Puccinia graminis f. sp. tritici CRL 75-36-700-3]|uniref:Secreted protein n=1 Tax=Puccinia graminis f. sp. tritici (strain CRL 75-36-700-3 / race SCCL) TaxID=418459 RepID=H6QV96_PUCGT|nr:uncharacterized protein PGTG_22692 [Puccinia graminis f. sp. tritici CRL 75-36-700-3]EHS62797.1 hypothetical protein PGTG_22692 [Puccinia graminis f. sp. tritici CRL 75-36-700-3]